MRSLARPPALSTAPSLMLQSPIYEGAVASSMAACRRASRPLSLSLAIFALKLLASIIGDASAYPAGLSPSPLLFHLRATLNYFVTSGHPRFSHRHKK